MFSFLFKQELRNSKVLTINHTDPSPEVLQYYWDDRHLIYEADGQRNVTHNSLSNAFLSSFFFLCPRDLCCDSALIADRDSGGRIKEMDGEEQVIVNSRVKSGGLRV